MLSALLIYAHPSDVFIVLIIFIELLFNINKVYKAKTLLTYSFGGVTIVVSLTSWMLIKGGGLSNLIYGLDSVLNYNPYFLEDRISLVQSIGSLLKSSVIFFLFYLISYFVIKEVNGEYNKNYKIDILTIFLSIVYCSYRYSGNYLLNRLGNMVLVMLLLKAKACLNDKKRRYYFLYIVVPVVASFYVTSLLTPGGIQDRLGLLIPLFIIMYIDLEYNNSIIINQILIILLVFTLNVSYYTYMYREENMNNLTYKVEKGIYKNLYTTPERGETVEQIELYLNSMLNSEDTVLFMETTPFAYLMSDAKAFSPSTWDLTKYSNGFNDDSLYQRYFNIKNGYPTYIVYINTGRDKVLSIDVDNYKFTKFVKNNYILQERKIIKTMEVVVYRLN